MPFFSKDPEESPESLERKFRVIFEERGRDASAWLRHAHALRTAARPLWDRLSDLGHIAMMLEGMAVEALAKAVRATQEPALVSDGRWTLQTHDLRSLVDDTGLTLNPDERSLLARLTGFVLWAGRYPIPLKSSDMTPRMLPGTKEIKMPPGMWIGPADRQAVTQIFDRLEALLPRG